MTRRVLLLLVFACCLVGDVSLAQNPNPKPGVAPKPKAPKRRPARNERALQAIKVTTEACRQRVTVSSDALFGGEKWRITSEGEEVMGALGKIIEETGKHSLTIEGHTDASGSAASNLRLSETRAQAVKNWLLDREIIPFNTPIKGYGGNRPAAPNTNPEGQQLNRRVEVLIDLCR